MEKVHLNLRKKQNICLMIKLMKNKAGKRRAFSERSSTDDKSEKKDIYKPIYTKMRKGSSNLKDK